MKNYVIESVCYLNVHLSSATNHFHNGPSSTTKNKYMTSQGRISQFYYPSIGHVVMQLVEALRYKPEGRGFNTRWSLEFFIDKILPAALWPTQPLTEMSTRNISWG
jgi:hypothetical protein